MAIQATPRQDALDLLTARAQKVRLDPSSPDLEILLSAARIIRHGGIVAYPTETFYGLAVDPYHSGAVSRLFSVKGRAGTEPLIMLLSRAEEAFTLADPVGAARDWYAALARRFWPGPLTLVLAARRGLACPGLAGAGSVAVRVSSHPLAWQLCRTVGGPITSTSANISGGEPPAAAEAIDPRLACRLDLTLDTGRTPGGMPSTLLDLSGARPVLLRAGQIPVEDLTEALGFAPRVRG